MLAEILKGLLHQTKLQILHYSHTSGKEKYHIVHPYTLLLHRDSLYLHAWVEDYGEIRTFLIDRIREVVTKDEKFRYPSAYDPDQLTDGSFGIFHSSGDKPVKVSVKFKEILWEYITTRKWHPSQRFSPVENRYFKMDVRLKNTDEFIPWILQFGSDAEVLKPRKMRNRVKKELRDMMGLY